MSNLTYPNLINCKIVTNNPKSPIEPPQPLTNDCVIAANAPLPTLHDFSVEERVLRKKEEEEAHVSDEGGSGDDA
eukprot:CAMPEP_0172513366 /NCGR_PEP_ID=MMETSP1066-20121228/251931_1 /TAXON_ID=671091 /ORGANISM="Coscinodiscus wailesii, Strain CCMP2513" /LENGTH=74 /DNA_ID=CAMNT_0013293591 /DNA_START=133 /DNA_END=357 /DNA_ORIENTATION=-